MEHFNTDTLGYNKEQVNAFVDYVIKTTEQNVSTIKAQLQEIKTLQEELEKYKNDYHMINYKTIENERLNNEIKELAKKEASLIINEAKDNANRIINEALLKAQKIDMDKELLNNNVKILKRKLKNNLLQQLELIDEIEVL